MCSRLGKKRASFGEPWFMSRRESSIGIRPSWVPYLCVWDLVRLFFVFFSFFVFHLVFWKGGEGTDTYVYEQETTGRLLHDAGREQ